MPKETNKPNTPGTQARRIIEDDSDLVGPGRVIIDDDKDSPPPSLPPSVASTSGGAVQKNVNFFYRPVSAVPGVDVSASFAKEMTQTVDPESEGGSRSMSNTPRKPGHP
jgi:hypothetical protein